VLQAKAVDGELGAVPFTKERLLGKHVKPRVGQLVKMSQQGLQRRRDAGRADPSRGGVGTVVRVNANWTCGMRTCQLCVNSDAETFVPDVQWHLTNQVREGYSTGTVNAGGHTRAFHLALIDSDTILPSRQQEHSANNVLESQREKFHLPVDHQEMM